VHGGDAAAHGRSADPWASRQVSRQGDGETQPGQQDRGDERNQRKRDVISVGNPRRERQHRDEMGRPDAEAGRSRRHRQPYRPHIAVGPANVMKKIDRRKRGERAHQGCKRHQTKVVLADDAIVDLQHPSSLEPACSGSPGAGTVQHSGLASRMLKMLVQRAGQPLAMYSKLLTRSLKFVDAGDFGHRLTSISIVESAHARRLAASRGLAFNACSPRRDRVTERSAATADHEARRTSAVPIKPTRLVSVLARTIERDRNVRRESATLPRRRRMG
jgi:hypothetical protein